MGFESKADAGRMLRDLRVRLTQFGLGLHVKKTRLIAFGRLPAIQRAKRGLPRPRTFAFLGFTHYCEWTRDGRFIVKHKTQSNATSADHSFVGGATHMARVTFGKICEGEAQWPRYSNRTDAAPRIGSAE